MTDTTNPTEPTRVDWRTLSEQTGYRALTFPDGSTLTASSIQHVKIIDREPRRVVVIDRGGFEAYSGTEDVDAVFAMATAAHREHGGREPSGIAGSFVSRVTAISSGSSVDDHERTRRYLELRGPRRYDAEAFGSLMNGPGGVYGQHIKNDPAPEMGAPQVIDARQVLRIDIPHVWDVDGKPRGVRHEIELVGETLVVRDAMLGPDGEVLSSHERKVALTTAVHAMLNMTDSELAEAEARLVRGTASDCKG